MLRSLLALNRLKQVSFRHYRGLIDRVLSQKSILDGNDFCLGCPEKIDWLGVERDLAWAQQPNHHIITLGSHHYPNQLKQIANPPLILFVAGDPQILAKPQLAIVGSRKPSPYGKKMARTFASAISKQGWVITSGLALGVDGLVHGCALQGGTIGVLGCGLDRIYPRHHESLAREVLDSGGALVTEFPIGRPPLPSHFPRRNRIISGLSMGTLVIEAGLKSGSLITARWATEQGREVFAVPGMIDNPLAQGCHALIKEGAKLVEQVGDVLDELNRFETIHWVADKAIV